MNDSGLTNFTQYRSFMLMQELLWQNLLGQINLHMGRFTRQTAKQFTHSCRYASILNLALYYVYYLIYVSLINKNDINLQIQLIGYLFKNLLNTDVIQTNNKDRSVPYTDGKIFSVKVLYYENGIIDHYWFHYLEDNDIHFIWGWSNDFISMSGEKNLVYNQEIENKLKNGTEWSIDNILNLFFSNSRFGRTIGDNTTSFLDKDNIRYEDTHFNRLTKMFWNTGAKMPDDLVLQELKISYGESKLFYGEIDFEDYLKTLVEEFFREISIPIGGIINRKKKKKSKKKVKKGTNGKKVKKGTNGKKDKKSKGKKKKKSKKKGKKGRNGKKYKKSKGKKTKKKNKKVNI